MARSILFQDSIPLTKNDCGVYGILNRISGRLYIGSSFNLSNRRSVHKYDFKNELHASQELEAEVNAHPENFEFILIERISTSEKKELCAREQFWMNFYQCCDPKFGYNQLPFAGSAKGAIRDRAYRDKMSKVKTGTKMPPKTAEQLERQRISHLGKRYPQYHKAVVQMDLSGKEIARFESITAASKSLGEKVRTGGICHHLTHPEQRKSAHGFTWRYA